MPTDFEQTRIFAASKNGFYSEEAERSILGNIVFKYDEYGHYVSEISEEDLFNPMHKVILRSIKRAKAEGLEIDLVTVGGMLDKIDPINARALSEELIACAQSFSQAYHAESYMKIVKELSVRRNAISLVNEIQMQLKDPSQAINGIMDKLRTKAGDMTISKHSWVSMQDVMVETYIYLERRAKGEIINITTGIPNLDGVIGGFFAGELTIIGARPAVGKSVFGMNVAMAAARQGFRVAICSREMTDIQYGQRILSYESRIDGMKLRKADIKDEDWYILAEAMAVASRHTIDFLFTVRSVEDLRAEVQRKIAHDKLDLLVVDYLQLMGTEQKFKEDRLRVGKISRALKEIAVDFNIPVIALAQVKRYAGGARAKMPTLEDLKDSGNLEQDADGVIFLHNPYDAEDEYVDPRDKEYFDRYTDLGYTYLCLGIAKQRQGSTGKVCVLFDKKTMRYLAIDRKREAQ